MPARLIVFQYTVTMSFL